MVNNSAENNLVHIHYDVSEHSISANQFIKAIECAQAIIQDMENNVFGKRFKYDLQVLPPEKGTFLETLLACGTVWLFAPEGRAYVKSLTGEETTHWMDVAGKETRKGLIKSFDASRLLAQFIKNFMEKTAKELEEEYGIPIKKFRSSYKAKNDFYQSCNKNEAIQGLGFDKTDKFPIRREEFPKYIASIPEKEESEWFVEIQTLNVTSPNWQRGDNRHWKGFDKEDKEVYFVIEDATFWAKATTNELLLKAGDSLTVQWAYFLENKKRKSIKVLRVLRYNNKHVSEPLNEQEIKLIITTYSQILETQAKLL